MAKGSPHFQLRLNPAERRDVEALAEHLGIPRATAVKRAIRFTLARLAEEEAPLNDPRPAGTEREELLDRREVADASQAYPAP